MTNNSPDAMSPANAVVRGMTSSSDDVLRNALIASRAMAPDQVTEEVAASWRHLQANHPDWSIRCTARECLRTYYASSPKMSWLPPLPLPVLPVLVTGGAAATALVLSLMLQLQPAKYHHGASTSWWSSPWLTAAATAIAILALVACAI